MAKNKINTGHVIVSLGVAFASYAMGRVFFVYDPDGWSVYGVNVGGLFLGAIINMIIGRAALSLPSLSANASASKKLLPKATKKQVDKKEERKRKNDFKNMVKAKFQSFYAHVGFYALLFLSGVLVAPGLYILWSEEVHLEPWIVVIMSIVGAIAPDVAIGVGGFVATAEPTRSTNEQKKSEPLSEESKPAGGGLAKGNGRSAKDKRSLTVVNDIPCPHAGAGCTKVGTQNAINAHASKCKFKPLPTSIENVIVVQTDEVKK